MFKQLSLFDNPVIANEAINDSYAENKRTTNLDTSKLAKLYYSISEVAEMFNVNASLLRYWEKEFPNLFIQLKKNKKGDRFYTKKDVDTLKTLFHLIKEKKMTLDGARDYLKNNKRKIKDNRSLLENLQNIRTFLVDLKNNIQ
jgi:DNA-binding transcriptional MerR regulator